MITVFGASVTQQKNGFATRIKKDLNLPVKIFGYGGMHLNNAGICFIDKVVTEKPSYCFIDWFSTGYNETDDKTVELINTIINKFSEIKCKLIFLFLPFKGNSNKDKFYLFCKSVLKKRKIFFIDVNTELCTCDIDKILRDSIHTTEYGSNLYSKIICQKFIENKNNIIVPEKVLNTKYTCIKKIVINREFNNYMKFTGNCEIVGFLLSIGPHSGMIEIVNESRSYTENTWDRWCSYTRKHFNLSMKVSGNVKMNILQTHFNTTSCNKQKYFKKKLLVHSIFYIGDNLLVRNMHSGCRIKKISIFRLNMLSRINRYKKKLFESLFGNKLQ